jgi:glycosyltransferase involved in cell wall biosynthesis
VYVAISRFVRDQLLEIGGLPPEKVVLLYAGIDPEVFKPTVKNHSDQLELVFCGQIMPEKGIDLLVDVVQELNRSGDRKVRLNIVGEGNLEPILRIKTRGNPAFNWVGYVNGPAEVARWYSYADAVVLPTRWDEAFSYVPLEAMGSGTPVIASRTGGNVEIVFEGRTGWHFNPSDRSGLYNVIRGIEKARCQDMGLYGREHIVAKHTLDAFGRKYSGLYRNMLERPDRIEQID